MTHEERLRELFRLMSDCPACGDDDIEAFMSDPYWNEETVRAWLLSHAAEPRFFE